MKEREAQLDFHSMASFQIRVATSEDDTAVAELLVNSYRQAYGRAPSGMRLSEERIQDLKDVAKRRAKGCVVVAEQDGRIVGSASVLRPGDPDCKAWMPEMAEIKYMAVEAEYRGKNVSRALLTEATMCALAWGARAICLFVPRGASGVAKLYQSRGFMRAPQGDRDLSPEFYLEAYLKELFPGEAQ